MIAKDILSLLDILVTLYLKRHQMKQMWLLGLYHNAVIYWRGITSFENVASTNWWKFEQCVPGTVLLWDHIDFPFDASTKKVSFISSMFDFPSSSGGLVVYWVHVLFPCRSISFWAGMVKLRIYDGVQLYWAKSSVHRSVQGVNGKRECFTRTWSIYKNQVVNEIFIFSLVILVVRMLVNRGNDMQAEHTHLVMAMAWIQIKLLTSRQEFRSENSVLYKRMFNFWIRLFVDKLIFSYYHCNI